LSAIGGFRLLKRVVIMAERVSGYDHADGRAATAERGVEYPLRPGRSEGAVGFGRAGVHDAVDSTQIGWSSRHRRRFFRMARRSRTTDALYHEWSARERGDADAVDPVAVTYAIRPELCPARPMRLDVMSRDLPGRGGQPNAQVCCNRIDRVSETAAGRIAARMGAEGRRAGMRVSWRIDFAGIGDTNGLRVA